MTGSTEAGPLRIVLIIGTLGRGGTEGQVVALAARLRQREHHVRIICMDAAGELGEEVRAAGVEVVESGYPGITWRSLRSLFGMGRAVFGIGRAVREHHPDVVHCFLIHANIVGVPLGRLARARVVLMSERSLQDAIRKRWFFEPLVWLARRWSDGIVCNSQAVLEDAVRTAGVGRRKTVVIRNGVEITDAMPGPPSSSPPMVLAIANLIAYKAHDVLLEAFAKVLERPNARAARLQLAGAGPEEGRLRAHAARLGIDGAVEFLGSVADVRLLLARCSFTVLPSYSEGMPNAVLESLAAGRPVIGTDVGGTAEILASGGGILVPPGDPGRLAAAMGGLIDDPAKMRELGGQGRAIVADLFGMERMVDETLGLYRRILQRRSRRQAAPHGHRDP